VSTRKTGIPLIAELAGVSIGTVDRALHGRPGINDETRQRILRIVEKIRYQPNQNARSLAIGKKIRIGLCVPREIAYFYNELWAGMRHEVRNYASTGVKFEEAEVPELGRGDRAAFRKLIAAGVDGIIVTPGDPESMNALINEAEKKDIRVLCVSTDAPQSKRSTIVAVEPRTQGLMAGELMANFLPSGSRAAVITGMLKTVDHREKSEGFAESFEQINRGKVVAIVEALEDERESHRRTRELLKAEPALTGIYVNTVNCLPVCRALTESGRAGYVRLIATDLFDRMVPLLRSGIIAASMHQRPYRQGQLAVRTLCEHLLRGTALPPALYLNPSTVLRSNLHLYREAANIAALTAPSNKLG
jgi:LacI family transcriptional regulator